MPKTKRPDDPPKKPRLVMDKVAERLQQECELMCLLNKDLLDVMDLLIKMAKVQSEQEQNFSVINARLKWIYEKYAQIDSNMLDSATLAKLYRFMAEADGVQITPMTYPKIDNTATD
jgi:hypothetical protein